MRTMPSTGQVELPRVELGHDGLSCRWLPVCLKLRKRAARGGAAVAALARLTSPQTRGGRTGSRTQTSCLSDRCPRPHRRYARGNRTENRTLLCPLVRRVLHQSAFRSSVGVAGIEPASTCSRSTRPTLSLDSVRLGRQESNLHSRLQRPLSCRLDDCPIAVPSERIELSGGGL